MATLADGAGVYSPCGRVAVHGRRLRQRQQEAHMRLRLMIFAGLSISMLGLGSPVTFGARSTGAPASRRTAGRVSRGTDRAVRTTATGGWVGDPSDGNQATGSWSTAVAGLDNLASGE